MKNKNIDSIPSLGEIQSLYEDALRKEAKAKSEESTKSLGEFFKNFRIEEKSDYSLLENKVLDKYKAYIALNKNYQKRAIEDLENHLAYEKFFLEVERKENQNLYSSNFFGSSFQTRARIERINEYNKKLKDLLASSPDAWEFYYERQLLRDIANGYNNSLVDLEYVIDAKKKIINSLKAGTPIYLVGHLGSGKTQLAREAAIEFSIENIIQDELEVAMNKWFLKNQDVSEAEAIEKFSQLNREKRTYYKNALAEGRKTDLEKIYPYFISGSYNLTYEDMFVEKTLSLEKTNARESDIDLVDKVVDQYLTWLKTHEKDFENLPYEKENLIKSKLWDSISEIFIARNSTYGTVVKKIEKEILLAVKNGSPVIIDELNTIAMENLIGLNDILQSKVGSMAYVTGLGPVRIKKGFGLIGTGNLSTDSVSYEGTQDLNPAFKSRFLTIEYNYVNQSTLGSLKNQTNSEKNELFRIVLSRLADKNGNLNIPNPKRTLEDLFRLCQLAKVSQEVFMGKWTNPNGEGEGGDLPELKESVLSMRNIFRVIDSWNLGEEKDLSLALWDGFVSSITNPKDQAFILSQALHFGFFKEADGWKIKSDLLGQVCLSYDDIRTRPYVYTRAEIETLSYLDLIKIIFGPMPERKDLPEFLKNIEDEGKISIETYEDLDQRLRKLEHTRDLITYLEDMETNRKWNIQLI